MSAVKGQKYKGKKIAKFSNDAEGGKAAKAYLMNVCNEGGWDSWEEFLNCYVYPAVAKRLDALHRWNAANNFKRATAPKKKSAKKSASKVTA